MTKFGFFWFALLQSSVMLAVPVSEQTMLDVGENELYLEISGPNSNTPLLLFLHGGPGNAALGLLPFQSNVGRQLEQDFLVVYLHQRGAGKSSPVADSEQTISAHIGDLVKVIHFLTERYDQNEVHLVGHSWGGMLAALYADRHREDVGKLVLIATSLHVRSMLRDSYSAAMKWAQEDGVSEAIAELAVISQSFNAPQDFMVVLRWADRAGGTAKNFDIEALIERHAIDAEYPNWREQQASIGRAMTEEMLEIDLIGSNSWRRIPALFVSGAQDTIATETTIRRDYGNYPGEKSFVLLEESHHLPYIDQPDLLAKAVRVFLLE